MDPNATLKKLIDAAVKGNASDMLAYAENLAWWMANGGFAPSDPRGRSEFE